MALDITVIRTAARAGRITWRYHALLRVQERGITRVQAIRVLTEGEIIEQRPRAKPFPKCLLIPTVCPSNDSTSMLSYQELPTSIQVWRGHSQEAKRGEAGRHRITRHVKR